MKITRHQLLLFLRLSRPHFLLGGLLLYALGASISSYLGKPVDSAVYILGQGIVTSIQLMTHYLNEYYDAPGDNANANRTLFSGGSGALGPEGLPRITALYAGIVAMASAAIFTVMLVARDTTPLLAWLVLIMAFVGAFGYSAPPLRLIHSGYGELVASFVVAGLIPTFAFCLQTGELHRLLFMTTLPLVALHFAMMISFEIPDYASDLKYGKRTLMVRAGWQTAMRFHDAAILFAGLAFLGAYLSGFPWRVSLGTLIAVPLGIAQIWQMSRIRRGQPPNWKILTLNAMLVFGLTAYLEWMGFIFS